MGNPTTPATATVQTMKSYWQSENGGPTRSTPDAPQWVHVRENMQKSFPAYYQEEQDSFTPLVTKSMQRLNKMRPAERDGPAFIGRNPADPDFSDVPNKDVPEKTADLDNVIGEVIDLFDGMPNWGHPMTMCNVIPPGNRAGIVAAQLSNTFTPSLLYGEYGWNVMKAELESAAMLSNLIGWDPNVAGGLYTFGGTGCYLYGMKYATASVLGRSSRSTGVRVNGKVIASQQGHYCMLNTADWLGIGMDNVVTVKTDDKTNAMDLEDLKEKIKEIHAEGLPVISIVCTMGTVDAFAIDDVRGVRAIIESPEYRNPEPYGNTFIYCDAVIGWSWLMFQKYNFEKNPLGFSPDMIPIMKQNYHKISGIYESDCVGVDFHKTGWAPFNCSMVVMKDIDVFRNYMRRGSNALLQERITYNPGLYTLEVSRSGSYAMAGWATLKYLGREGFQSILGGILHVKKYLRDMINSQKDMVCANPDDHGFVTLIRVYKPDTEDAEVQFEKERTDPNAFEELQENNKLQQKTANIIWDWFRSGKKIDGMYGPYTSYTSGFRPTKYNREFDAEKGVIYAIKSFPMNINASLETMETLIKQIRIARDMALGLRKRPETLKEKRGQLSAH